MYVSSAEPIQDSTSPVPPEVSAGYYRTMAVTSQEVLKGRLAAQCVAPASSFPDGLSPYPVQQMADLFSSAGGVNFQNQVQRASDLLNSVGAVVSKGVQSLTNLKPSQIGQASIPTANPPAPRVTSFNPVNVNPGPSRTSKQVGPFFTPPWGESPVGMTYNCKLVPWTWLALAGIGILALGAAAQKKRGERGR